MGQCKDYKELNNNDFLIISASLQTLDFTLNLSRLYKLYGSKAKASVKKSRGKRLQYG